MKEVIQNSIATHDPEMRYMPPGMAAGDGESGGMDTEGVLSVINNILDQTVRPYIHSHGGELELLAFDPEKNELLVTYQGTCGHCAFSTEGTLYLIQDILREEYDPRITVKVA